MADFLTCFNFTMGFEDPRREYETVPDATKTDPQAQAISGINSEYWPDEFAAIAALPAGAARAQAVESFYREHFWEPWMEQIACDNLTMHVFDSAVNQGFGTAERLLQRAANVSGAALVLDGVVGPKTLAAVNGLDCAKLLVAFTNLRCQAYTMDGGPNVAAWIARAWR